MPSDAYDLRVISLGAGVQSSALYRLAVMGEIGPKPDYAIFADTQQEPPWVYETVEDLRRWGDIPIVVRSRGDLGEHLRAGKNSTGQKFSSVPFWVEGADGKEVGGRRQCTREYKIDVVRDAVKEILGVAKGARVKGRYRVEQWVGISTDEAQRAKPSRYEWIANRFPLLFDKPMSRGQIRLWMEKHGFPLPGKSACVFCPFRSPVEYARLRDSNPELFAAAVRWDEAIRDTGTGRRQYVWRALRPLRELPPLEELEGRDDAQLDLWGNECEGMCGV